MGKTKILGQASATADQMAAYLLSVNPNPQISMDVKAFCQLYLDVAAREGVRGDALFAQSCKETGNFKFQGTVKAGQNNFAGLGTTDPAKPGASFADPATGILAQAQHAKAYATKAAPSCTCVDPRYYLLVRYGKTGTAQHWEELGGKWAVPGYDTKKYKSLEEADASGDSYGYQIIKILNKILKMQKEEGKLRRKPIIAIDAGHGLGTPGKRCLKSIDPAQTREWYLNDRIADDLQARLGAYECTVVRIDDTTGKKDISLSARVKAANAANADMYISIHHNAGINGGVGGGTVVYYYSSAAARPGQAQRLYDAVVRQTGLRGNRSGKVLKKGFYVVKTTKAPAFLIENGFMDSVTDTPIILTAAHARKTAQGILDFLVAELHLAAASGEGSYIKPSAGSTYYPAYTGRKTTLAAALASLGIDSSYAFRKKIAAANGIKLYAGTAAQNTRMYNLLVAGVLIKA